jgi:hypothetical protein
VHPTAERPSIVKCLEVRMIGLEGLWGLAKVASVAPLAQNGFIKDDTLRVKVELLC